MAAGGNIGCPIFLARLQVGFDRKSTKLIEHHGDAVARPHAGWGEGRSFVSEGLAEAFRSGGSTELVAELGSGLNTVLAFVTEADASAH